MSLGKDRVRAQFNPSASSAVDLIKQKTAELIDLCGGLREGPSGEVDRCVALAQTAYEEAAMWAVKAATANK